MQTCTQEVGDYRCFVFSFLSFVHNPHFSSSTFYYGYKWGHIQDDKPYSLIFDPLLTQTSSTHHPLCVGALESVRGELLTQPFSILSLHPLPTVSACKRTWGQHLTFTCPAYGISSTSMTMLRTIQTFVLRRPWYVKIIPCWLIVL